MVNALEIGQGIRTSPSVLLFSVVTVVGIEVEESADCLSDSTATETSVTDRTFAVPKFFSLRFSPRARRSFSAHFAALST